MKDSLAVTANNKNNQSFVLVQLQPMKNLHPNERESECFDEHHHKNLLRKQVFKIRLFSLSVVNFSRCFANRPIEMAAEFVMAETRGLQKAATRLQSGGLVAFPTETVYGLGANALDEKAVLSIFTAKQRPLTDPLIVHVPTLEKALQLVQLDQEGETMFKALGERFWPGPLTIIAKARPHLPLCVSANTGFVGIRIPSHPIALKLLEVANVPVCAPSANRFGHVSPTTAQHVYNDLADSPMYIIKTSETTENCQIGIESSVVKILPHENKLLVYRRGGTSDVALQKALPNTLIEFAAKPTSSQSTDKVEEEGDSTEAPGQLLTHYAPDVLTYLYQQNTNGGLDRETVTDSTVILDFNKQLVAHKEKCLRYLELSDSDDAGLAAKNIFDMLRNAENIPGANKIIIADVLASAHEMSAAVHDRMYRAASGKVITLL